MGSKSSWAHVLGCTEWVPPGAGSREGILGRRWWFSCPSGPMVAIHADADIILTHTCKYIQIPTDTYISIHTGGSKIPTAVTYLHDTGRFLQIHQIPAYTYSLKIYLPPLKIHADTCIYLQYLHIPTLHIPTDTEVDPLCFGRYHVGIM